MSIVVIDIGGTWLRHSFYEPSNSPPVLSNITKIKAPWKDEKLNDPNQLCSIIYGYLSKILENEDSIISGIGISLGACINHHTGIVLGSSPILGENKVEIDLLKYLEERVSLPIVILNDISALCFGHLFEEYEATRNFKEIAALTLSSGVAMRRINVHSETLIVDNRYGIQGEVGHLSTVPPKLPWSFSGMCECGVKNHIASFLSGKGLNRVFNDWLSSQNRTFERCALGIAFQKNQDAIKALVSTKEDEVSQLIFNSIGDQLSFLLDFILAITPIDKIFISGGIVTALGNDLEEITLNYLSERSYIYDRGWFNERICFKVSSSDHIPLKGMGYYVSNALLSNKNNFIT